MREEIGVLEAARERAVALLCDHFARDDLSVDELEARLDRAHGASTREELSALFSDLPGRGGELTAVGPSDNPSPRRADGRPVGTTGEGAGSKRSGIRRRNRNDLAMAVMSGAKRSGVWYPAERTIAFSCMGGVTLDFREASLEAGVTDVLAVAIMGGIDIVVPPGVVVESGGLGFMGGFDHVPQPPLPYQDSGRPVIRINGVALMGGVRIEVRHPGESAAEARKRKRRERKEARRRKSLGR